jgi:hypothetical protein
VTFAFDTRRTAIPLLGGDKSGRWNTWHETAVPLAEHLYGRHLGAIADEGLTDDES